MQPRDVARRALSQAAAFLDLPYEAQLLLCLLALEGGWGEAAPAVLLTRYAGGHALGWEEMTDYRDLCARVGLLCCYEVAGRPYMHLSQHAVGLRPPTQPPCPTHAQSAPQARPTMRKRPAGMAAEVWDAYCGEQIAGLLAQLPADPLVAAWRAHAASARPQSGQHAGEMVDLGVLVRLHSEGSNWRRGIEKALARGATSITYVETVARDPGAARAAPALVPQMRPGPDLSDPAVREEQEIRARNIESARAYAARLRVVR